MTACGVPEFSPWQTKVDSHNLTAKHLSWLSSNKSFSNSFKIVLTGDPQAVVGYLRKVIRETNNLQVDFITILGDLTDLGLRREWIWIDQTISKSNKPVLTVVGNHDGLTEGDDIYQSMFGSFNYSFMHRGYKFVMWNNNFYEWGDPDFEWLEQEVLSEDNVIVMSHQPPYSGTLKQHHEDRWKQIRKHTNYKASLHGHLHHFGYKFEEDTDTHVYTVDRVTGTHFGTLTIGDNLTFENCRPECEVVEE